MADVEKVKQGLDRCKHGDGKYCFVCPYAKENKKPFPPICNKELCNDALSVIEELQAEIKRLTKPAGGTWIQKADATGHEYSMCSACETVINTPDGCGGYYKLDMTGAKYCPNCGAKMD